MQVEAISTPQVEAVSTPQVEAISTPKCRSLIFVILNTAELQYLPNPLGTAGSYYVCRVISREGLWSGSNERFHSQQVSAVSTADIEI